MSNRILTNCSTPAELQKWLDKNIKYKGVFKNYLYTAEEVVSKKEGHCWETAELVYIELTRMGYEAKLIYTQDKKCEKVTHTAVLYKIKNRWIIFDEILFGDDTLSICTPDLKTMAYYVEGLAAIVLKDRELQIRIGYSPILEKTTQIKYVENCMSWDKYY